MGATGLFVIAMVSWAPYVSDYSRYLPETVSKAKTFWAVVLGCAIPQIFCAILGAYITGLLPHAPSTVAAVGEIAGRWALPVMAVSLIGSDVANAYTGMLALASIVSCVKDVRHSVSMRVVGSLLLIAAGPDARCWVISSSSITWRTSSTCSCSYSYRGPRSTSPTITWSSTATMT